MNPYRNLWRPDYMGGLLALLSGLLAGAMLGSLVGIPILVLVLLAQLTGIL